MKKQESKLLIMIMVLTILLVEFIIFGGLGIAVPMSVVGFYVISFWHCRRLGIKQDLRNQKLMIPIVLMSLCFGLFDNNVLKFFNIFFLYGLIVLQTSEQYKINFFKPFTKGWLLEIGQTGIIKPLQHLDAPIKVIREQMNEGGEEVFKKVGKILLGCIIALPLLFIATSFLMYADVAFSGIIHSIRDFTDIDMGWMVKRFIAIGIVYFPLYGFFYGLYYRKDFIGPIKEKPSYQVLDFTIVITVAILLCCIYVLYCLSQFAYFISAFKGILPAGYTCAEYARKGFFELLPVIMINLGMIAVLDIYTQGRESYKKNNWRKAVILFLDIFTGFLGMSALAKMLFYMGEYGLTLKRLYVAWFIILVMIILILVIIRLFREEIPFIKYSMIVFIVMYIGLNYSNLDYVVAKYNTPIYLKQYEGDMTELNQLSSSAVGPIIALYEQRDLEVDYTMDDLLEVKRNRVSKEKWQQWNIASHRAKKQLERHSNNK